jgi:hypothetical protein|tara:strand:- start:244 stop:435 length:192 start_codon:yes stop_codon:yes gene_type:complete
MDRLIEMVSDSKVEMDLIEAFENEDLYKVKDGEFKDWYVMMYYNLIDDSLEEIEVSRKKSELI